MDAVHELKPKKKKFVKPLTYNEKDLLEGAKKEILGICNKIPLSLRQRLDFSTFNSNHTKNDIYGQISGMPSNSSTAMKIIKLVGATPFSRLHTEFMEPAIANEFGSSKLNYPNFPVGMRDCTHLEFLMQDSAADNRMIIGFIRGEIKQLGKLRMYAIDKE